MITQMTPGLWGGVGGSVVHTSPHRHCDSTGPHMRPPDWTSPGGLPPVLVSLLGSDESSEWPNKFQRATKELKGHERDGYLLLSDTQCRIPIQLPQPFATPPGAWHWSLSEFRLGPLTRMWWIRCSVSFPFPLPFLKCVVHSPLKRFYNTQLLKLIPFSLISLLSGQRQSAGVFAHLSYISPPRIENKDKTVNLSPLQSRLSSAYFGFTLICLWVWHMVHKISCDSTNYTYS